MSPLDKNKVTKKILFIKEQKEDIKKLLYEKKKEEILSDPWLIKGLKYSLQTAVEAMIDIIYHITAKHFNKAPVDARDALNILYNFKVIDEKELTLYSKMIGFRNKIVHGYEEVSPEKVIEIAENNLNDFDKFVKKIKENFLQ
ncbi:type VII toxin-antitoxin system HepT family RNase toxin [Thermovenabulum gondwanense]|uniref:DUF86 domain-containing protein n=1 Tax=Thermovenabulum gondwanense TaxID=520767 RepID=A0A162MHZ9_9FIRM|nr:DUF86 domain-containing protein [Thermovenabulum gondwanense]KYO66116.1 hypothetical protein ATZ99_13080 [Thermovenabulum gondwanense]